MFAILEAEREGIVVEGPADEEMEADCFVSRVVVSDRVV